MERKKWELRKLFEAVEQGLGKMPAHARAIEKLGGYLRGSEKPHRETLDRISLLVGFQDWESFKVALHGDNDGLEGFGKEHDGDGKEHEGEGKEHEKGEGKA